MCVSVCMSRLASDSSETVEVTSVKRGTVTASDMLMHHVLIIFTLTFIQRHTDLSHENNKGLIISEAIQAMTIKTVVKIVRLYDHFQSDDLDFHSRSQVRLKLDYFLTCSLGQYFSYYIQTWHNGTLMDALYAYAQCVMQGHIGSTKAKYQRCMLSATKQVISLKLATTTGHFVCDLDLDFANVYAVYPACLSCI